MWAYSFGNGICKIASRMSLCDKATLSVESVYIDLQGSHLCKELNDWF